MNGFTGEQRRAIELRGNVLVLAGAGTGKTRTLVHRCVEWLLEGPANRSLEQVLMVTFTDAAAAEMRQRIRDELKRRSESQESAREREQLALLESAFICTLHGFCFRLVRQHFAELELDPQLTVLAEEEAHLLAQEALDGLFKRFYAGTSESAQAVQRLIQSLARGRDEPVRRLVWRWHQYLQTLPDPAGWVRQQLALFSLPDPQHWREWLMNAVAEWKQEWEPLVQSLGPGLPQLAQCRAALQRLPCSATLSQAREALQEVAAADANWPRGTKKEVRVHLSDFFAEAAFLGALTRRKRVPAVFEEPREAAGPGSGELPTDDPVLQDWEWVRSSMITLLELTRQFGREFGEAKRELGVVDFHDLEQFSLRLLWNTARQRPTPLAQEWREKLHLLFVDEYQDINAAQDSILRALGGEDLFANRFLVGDPKQSIYRFRRADPHIFQRYSRAWAGNAGEGRVVRLADNFRSREAILDFVNGLFGVIMRQEIGGVAYDAGAHLQFGNPAGRREFARQTRTDGLNGVPPVELHLRLSEKDPAASSPGDDGEGGDALLASLNNAEKEARLIGLRLRDLRESRRQVWDAAAGQYRPVQWSDMVILLRSPLHKAEGYAKEFTRLGIPLVATRGGLFEHSEISDLLSLLRVLDNPLQDIPLLAVLRSPFAALTLDELAVVRLAGKGRFWISLNEFHRSRAPEARSGPDADTSQPRPSQAGSDPALDTPALRLVMETAWTKVDGFLRQFRGWRRWIRATSLSQGLDLILAESHYAAFLMGGARGQQQRGNLTKLLGWARRFDQFQRQGLYRFLKFIDAQQEAQIDHEPAPVQADHAVRLMSIHQSKGLEFAVVVVADLGKLFNFDDLNENIILDEQFGICPQVKPPFTEQRYPSLAHWLARRRQRRETLGEEMRLLYVAMTRACQCLILAGTAVQSAPDRWATRRAATQRDLLAARSYLDWIGPWMCQATSRSDWATAGGESPLLRWVIYRQDDLPSPAASKTGASELIPLERTPSSDPNLCEALIHKLAWQYPWAALAGQAAKVSVSKLRAGIVAELEEETFPPRRRWPRSQAGLRERKNAASVGVAHHLFLQHVSLDQVRELSGLQAEAGRMERERLLTAEDCQALDLEAIAEFWRGNIGQDILRHRRHLHRELTFTARLSLAELRQLHAPQWTDAGDEAGSEPSRVQPLGGTAGGEDEFVLLTGVVDLAVILPGEIWILDFKTDVVEAGDCSLKAREYEPQLRLYGLALSRIYARPVTQRWLHWLSLRRTLP